MKISLLNLSDTPMAGYFLSLAFLLPLACGCSNNSRAPESGVGIVSNGQIDFGVVPVGAAPLTAVLSVENPLSEPIEITGVKPSCGCIATKFALGQLQPGESFTFDATLRLDDYKTSQLISKHITVAALTSEGNLVHERITMRVEIKDWVDCDPSEVILRGTDVDFATGEVVTELRLKRNLLNRDDFRNLAITHPICRISIESQTQDSVVANVRHPLNQVGQALAPFVVSFPVTENGENYSFEVPIKKHDSEFPGLLPANLFASLTKTKSLVQQFELVGIAKASIVDVTYPPSLREMLSINLEDNTQFTARLNASKMPRGGIINEQGSVIIRHSSRSLVSLPFKITIVGK